MQTTATEIELLYAWRQGDAAAGNELMRRYYPLIRRFFGLRAPDVVDDLAQSTLLACTEKRERVEASSFRGYLFGIAHKLLLRHRRDEYRRAARASLKEPPPPSILTPSGVAALRQEHWLVLRALEKLPVEQQVVIALYYVEGLRTLEIGDALECPVSTVTSRLHRAREALKKQLERLKASPGVRGTVLENFEDWVRSLGSIAGGDESSSAV